LWRQRNAGELGKTVEAAPRYRLRQFDRLAVMKDVARIPRRVDVPLCMFERDVAKRNAGVPPAGQAASRRRPVSVAQRDRINGWAVAKEWRRGTPPHQPAGRQRSENPPNVFMFRADG
jgi:hypothetical protein